MGYHNASSPKENIMIRKFAIAAAAIVALGTTSLVTSTPAAAGKGGHHGGHFHGLGIGLGFGSVVDSCYREVWTVNRRGEPVLRSIYVCD
jgi:hypothetical protein